MKTGKYLIVLSASVLLGASVSFNAFALDDVNTSFIHQTSGDYEHHVNRARQHERIAREMQAKADEKVEILGNKPSTSFLGRNGKKHKSRIVDKIHKYEQLASESIEKAAYHTAVANGLASNKSYAQPNQMENQLNKARIKSDKASGL
ncbi:MAG: hypothetical protein KDF59_07585 [Nitrosomonas sp.]|nr:hypothetical protein [Nitrosomonas sp.]